MKTLTLFCLFSFVYISAQAQLLPIFTQKLSDNFLYDPSVTGLSGGSAVLSHKRLWSEVQGAPVTTFASAHTRLKQDRLGIGGSIYYEEANIFQNAHASLSAAYHLPLNEAMGLSFGLAGEAYQTRLNTNGKYIPDATDQLLTNFDDGIKADVSFGMNLHHSLFRVGASVNRLTVAFDSDKQTTSLLTSFATLYASSFLPVRDGLDRLEPSLVYRQQFGSEGQLDAMLFYDYKQTIIFGASYRTGGIVGLSTGYNFENRLVLGFTYEMLTGDFSNQVGASYEFVVRFNFNKQYYESKTRTTRPLKSSTFEKKQIEKER